MTKNRLGSSGKWKTYSPLLKNVKKKNLITPIRKTLLLLMSFEGGEGKKKKKKIVNVLLCMKNARVLLLCAVILLKPEARFTQQ